jgi:hypothetical protein
MKRAASAGLVLVISAALAVSGCTDSSRTGQAPSTSAAAPAPSPSGLALTVGDFARTSYRFTVTANEGAYTGGIDPIADTLDTTISVSSQGSSLKIDTIGLGGDYFTRITGLPLPGFDGATWYAVDTSRIRATGALGISATKDPTGIRALIAAARTATKTGDRSYRGTVDLTKVAQWGPVNIAQVTQLGEPARSVPFEATVDERGRLATMKVTIPGDGSIKANTVTASYRDLGAPVPVTLPTNPEPLPATLYALLAGGTR